MEEAEREQAKIVETMKNKELNQRLCFRWSCRNKLRQRKEILLEFRRINQRTFLAGTFVFKGAKPLNPEKEFIVKGFGNFIICPLH